MDTTEQFLTDHQDANGNLSDADMTKLLTGGHQGDTAAATSADTGAPDAGSEAQAAASKVGGKTASIDTDAADVASPDDKSKPDPVILAKDGVHTIEYQKLLDAREEARAAKAELAALKANGGAATPEADTPKSDADLAAAHFRAIYSKHPDADTVVQSEDYQQWLAKQPTVVRSAYTAVLTTGSAADVNEMLDAFKAAQPRAAAPAVPSAQEKVAGIVAAVKSKTPLSLSDIPAGAAAHHDETEAMAEMGVTDLMAKFGSMTPAQREAAMRRLV